MRGVRLRHGHERARPPYRIASSFVLEREAVVRSSDHPGVVDRGAGRCPRWDRGEPWPRGEGRPRAVRRRAAALAVLFVVFVAGIALAQRPGDPAHAFFEPVEVPLVNVEVYVSDGQGHPVAGLTPADFEVFEDGVPVEVTNFYAAPQVATAAPEAAINAAAVQEEPPPEQASYLVIYLDDLNLAPQTRRATFNHLRDFLAQDLPEHLQLMFVTYDGSVHLRVPFTNDPSELVAALDTIAGEAALSADLERMQILHDIQSTSSALAGTSQPGLQSGSNNGGVGRVGSQMGEGVLEQARGYIPQIRAYAEASRQRTRHALGNLQEFVRSLSGVPGRKAILLVSDGLEMRPGEGLFVAWEQAFPEVARQMGTVSFNEARRFDLSEDFRELVHFANGQRVSFYTLSNMGSKIGARVSAEGRGNIGAGGGAEALQAMAEEQSVMYLAGGTGGRTFANSPGLSDRLGEVSEELAAYYSLGYRPDHLGDDTYHTLTVRVRRDGVKVRHREGYLDSSAADRMADRTLAAAVLGVTENSLGISVETQEVRPKGDGTFMVPVMVQVPLDQLVLVPLESEHSGRITILLVVRSQDGGMSPIQRREYPISVTNDQLLTALHQSAGFVLGLQMRSGPQRIAVGVRDEVARTEATTTLEVDIQPPAAGEKAHAAS